MAQEYNFKEFDHIIFSYHGLPLSHIQKVHAEESIQACNCEQELPEYGHLCYKAACYASSRLLVKKLGIEVGMYSVRFQSRLNKNWLTPFTDENVLNLAKQGKKTILIFAPAFVADCLETKVELGIDDANLFQNGGGEKFVLVESLNASDAWVKALDSIMRNQI